jgi:hypothetical protein
LPQRHVEAAHLCASGILLSKIEQIAHAGRAGSDEVDVEIALRNDAVEIGLGGRVVGDIGDQLAVLVAPRQRTVVVGRRRDAIGVVDSEIGSS